MQDRLQTFARAVPVQQWLARWETMNPGPGGGGQDRTDDLGVMKKTRAFSELLSHYLFAEKFDRPAKGND